jgi:hypothetical protein
LQGVRQTATLDEIIKRGLADAESVANFRAGQKNSAGFLGFAWHDQVSSFVVEPD